MLWSSIVILITSVLSLFTGVGVVITGTELTMIVEALVALASAVGIVADRYVAGKKKGVEEVINTSE